MKTTMRSTFFAASVAGIAALALAAPAFADEVTTETTTTEEATAPPPPPATESTTTTTTTYSEPATVVVAPPPPPAPGVTVGVPGVVGVHIGP